VEYDRRSDAFARSVLASLGPTQQNRLVMAMADVERLLGAAAVEMQIEPADSGDAVWCLEQYYRELAERFESGYDPGKTRSASVAELTPPAGCFVVARLDGEPIGCGALKIGTEGICEIKRMWVHHSVRGFGIGRRIIRALESEARKYGASILRLDTNRALKEAQAMYRACGYREVAPFNDEFYAHHWFEKTISGRQLNP
jgi:GNAT superfamily N-acetyltransferase